MKKEDIKVTGQMEDGIIVLTLNYMDKELLLKRGLIK